MELILLSPGYCESGHPHWLGILLCFITLVSLCLCVCFTWVILIISVVGSDGVLCRFPLAVVLQ